MKQKIAIFHELPPGGARRVANDYAKYLKEKYFVDLYYIDQNEDITEKKYADNVFFFKFLPKKWTGGNAKVKLYKDTVELIKLYLLHRKIANKINSQDYKFVFVHGSQFTQAPFILQLIKTKKIYYCQEALRITMEEHFAIDKSLSKTRQIYERINRIIRKNIDKINIKCADLVLTNSTFSQKNLLNAYGIKGILAYLGVDTSIFYPEGKQKKFDLLFIGSYDFVDGYPLLKDSLKKIKDKITIKYKTHKDGWVSDAVMRDFYNTARCTICFGYREPFGLIPVESMACGTPVIALNEGGYKDSVINNKTGILVERNADEIARKLSILLKDITTQKNMSKNAIDYIKKSWTWEKRISEFNNLTKKYL